MVPVKTVVKTGPQMAISPDQYKKEADYVKEFIPAKIEGYISRKVDKDLSFWCNIDPTTGIQRKVVSLIGESGSGKNSATIQYAAGIGLPLLIVPCDDSQVLKELLGFWKASAGSTIWCEGLLTQFLRHPSVVLFDEVNCLPSGRLFMLHELFQNRKLFIKEAPAEYSMVHVHPEVRLLSAMNPPEAKYSGTNRLNTALANRSVFVEIKPFKNDEILTVKTGDVNMDAKIIQFYKETTSVIKTQKLRISISKRKIDTIASAIAGGLDVGSAVSQGFVNSALATASIQERDALLNLAITVFGVQYFKDITKE
jgi:nitric oxide reductase NorQ protein